MFGLDLAGTAWRQLLGETVLLWGCISAKGVGETTFIPSTVNSGFPTQIWKRKMAEEAWQQFFNMAMILNTLQKLHKLFLK